MYQVEFVSTFEEVDTAIEKIINYLVTAGDLNIKPHTSSILFACRELFNNAVEHGNKFDSGKKIIGRISCSTEEVTLEVCDEGKGFVINGGSDIYRSEQILKTRDRGISTIKKMGFTVSVNQNQVIAKLQLT